MENVDMAMQNQQMENPKIVELEKDTQKLGDLGYNIMLNEDTGNFIILYGDRILFRGVEGQFSVLKLFNSLNIKHTVQKVVEQNNDNGFTVKDDGTIVRSSELSKVNEMKEKISSGGNSQPSSENNIIIFIIAFLIVAFCLSIIFILLEAY